LKCECLFLIFTFGYFLFAVISIRLIVMKRVASGKRKDNTAKALYYIFTITSYAFSKDRQMLGSVILLMDAMHTAGRMHSQSKSNENAPPCAQYNIS